MNSRSPYAGFQGQVGKTFASSKPWWPNRPEKSSNTNVILIVADDMGYSDLGCYGSEIATPNIDQLASRGLRYTNFHSNTICSPSRAALMTGVNAHMTGVGAVQTEADPGFPGYTGELSEDVTTLAELFRANGYSTCMVGKWHLAKESDHGESASRRSWPIGRGFEKYYGILGGMDSYHQPSALWSDNQRIYTEDYPDGYYLTDDLTDQSIRMLKECKASDPTKPVFLYLAHPAVHAPLQAKQVDIARYRDLYSEGWDEVRRKRYERQVNMGILPPGTPLPPRNYERDHDVVAWDSLSSREQALFQRYMEVYAAMVDSIDQSVGRIMQCLDSMGESEDTLVVFTSDNGASREGQESGTTSYYHMLTSHPQGVFQQQFTGAVEDPVEYDYSRMSLIGGPRALSHYPRGWAMVSNTPFRMYKMNTHAGGHQVPFVISWPKGLQHREATRRQYTHLVDVFPTYMDLLNLKWPSIAASKERKPLAGQSFARSIEDSNAPAARQEQYYQTFGHRGFYREGWEAVTLHIPGHDFNRNEWELYKVDEDLTEITNLAHKYPSKVRELADAWEEAAWTNQVFPIDEGSGIFQLQRPEWESLRAQGPTKLLPGTPTLDRFRSQLLVRSRCFSAVARICFAHGDQGALFAHGDQGGGYIVYIEDEHLFYVHNAFGKISVLDGGIMAPGEHEVCASITAPGGWVWNVELLVDGRQVAAIDGLPMHSAMTPFQGIDVGVDSKSPVYWDLRERHGTFKYEGTLEYVLYCPGDLAPDARQQHIEMLRERAARYD